MIRPSIISMGVLIVSALLSAQTTPAAAPAAKSKPSSSKLLHNVYQEAFSPPPEKHSEMQRLRESIRKINQTSLPKSRPIPQPITTPTKVNVAKPVKSAPSAGPKPILTEQILKDLCAKLPESIADPIRLGDALSQAGHTKEALVFYRGYLENSSPEDRSWMLYQMIQCLLESDPAQAQTVLLQLNTEFPNSPWTQLAKAQGELLDWLKQNRPRVFLKKLQQELDDRIDAKGKASPRTDGQAKTNGSGPRPAKSAAAAAINTLGTPGTPPAAKDTEPLFDLPISSVTKNNDTDQETK